MTFTIFVAGDPVTQGSKKAFAYQPKGGGRARASVVDDNKKGLRDWRARISVAAQFELDERLMVAKGEAVKVGLVFHLKRPQSHYRTGRHAGKLKERAATLPHTSKPDLDKLVRAVFDALKGVVYVDDSQVAAFGETRKQYVQELTDGDMHPPGVSVTVSAISQQE